MPIDAAISLARNRWGSHARVSEETTIDADGTRVHACTVGRIGKDAWAFDVLGQAGTFEEAFEQADKACGRLPQERRVR